MTATVFINGVIGGDFFDLNGEDQGTTLADVKRQYESFHTADAITVYINSVGGDVREGFAIHDYLRAQGKPVTTIGEGKVYSIATVILLAGDDDKRLMRPNAEFLIHNPQPSFPVQGDAEDFERIAAELRKVEKEIADFYATKTGLSPARIRNLMDSDTQIRASEAVEMGFVSGIQEHLAAVAFFNINHSDMSTAVESKEAKGILAELKSLISGFKNSQPEPEPVPEPVKQDDPPEGPDVEELQKQIADLTDQLEAKSKEAEAAKVNSDKLAETIATQAKAIAAIEAKVTELESMPVVQAAPAGNAKVVNEGKEDEGHYKAFTGLGQALIQKYNLK